MKSIIKFFILGISLILIEITYAQEKTEPSPKSRNMKAGENKKVVFDMYETILNQKKIEQTSHFIDSNYIQTFHNANKVLFEAFPDITFNISEIIEENDKVVTFYTWTGAHKSSYKNIPATNKKVQVEGVSIYRLKDGKIFSNVAYPDKYSFFQQLAIIPKDISKPANEPVYFVDRFTMPKTSYPEFFKRLEFNRRFIKNLNGFIRDEKMEMEEPNGKIVAMTVAVWENLESLNNAKKLVQEEYEKINFNPLEFHQKFDITMKREIFSGSIK